MDGLNYNMLTVQNYESQRQFLKETTYIFLTTFFETFKILTYHPLIIYF